MAIPTLKTGWLTRESSILKRWKRNWFVLYGDGNLAYFKDESLNEREGNLSIPYSCICVKTALECEVGPPEGRNYGTLLKLVSKQHESSMVVSANDSDEALAWKLMIEQFIPPAPKPVPAPPVVTGPPPPHVFVPQGHTQVTQYTTYPNGTTTMHRYPTRGRRYTVRNPVYYNPTYNAPLEIKYDSYGRPYYVHPQTQVITVVGNNDPYYYRSGDIMLGAAAGVMLGAALWSPFLFF